MSRAGSFKTHLMVGTAALSMWAFFPLNAAPAASRAIQDPSKPTQIERAPTRRAASNGSRSTQQRSPTSSKISRVEGSPTVEGGEIIVTGIRQSVKNSIDRKRNARQIVDVVTAEDAGKLPDNNVVEALARVTGITVTRSQGRANGYNIRGLAGVQTTINGIEGSTAPLPGGEGRTLSLESLPAELIKSVEVYKSRTADQIEGGIGGTVNVELRRPLDLRKGITIAGGYKNQYSELGDLWSPSGTLLAGSRFETSIGEMGFLLNGAYSKPKYQEAYNFSESPDLVGCPTCVIRRSLPAMQQATLVTPYRAAYGENSGDRKQKSLSGVWQWRANEKLQFVLEGSYVGEESRDQFNSLFLRTREDYYTLQNLRISPSGALLGYDIRNLPNANGTIANFGKVNAGFTGGENRGKTNTYRTNFETHFESTGVKIDASAQYQWSNNRYYSNTSVGTYRGLTSARVDFDSPLVKGNGPYFEFNVSPTDPALARIESLADNIGSGKNTQLSGQIDIWKEIDPTGLLRDVKFGSRLSRNTSGYNSSYRFAGWFDPARQPLLSAIPGVDAVTVTPDLPGGSPLSWVQLNSRQLYQNWSNVRQFILSNNPEFLDGIGRDQGVNSLFATDRPNADDIVYSSEAKENIFSAYATAAYGGTVVFPVDGNIGLRYINTYNNVTGRNLQIGSPILNGAGQPTGTFGPDVVQTSSVRNNYTNLLPSAFANIHFTEKLLLRGSYSRNLQRPGLFDLRNFRQIDYRNAGSPVFAGNPNLKPTITNDFNASLEWYFGPSGIISVTAFSKEQKGFIYYTRQREFVPELGDTRDVYQSRNAGPGKTQGIEFQATTFFNFLPSFLSHLGATANATWIPTADLSLPVESTIQPESGPVVYDLVTRRAPFTSRWSYNLIGYYETATFSARLAYNWRSKYQTAVDAVNQSYIISSRATSRLDGALNITPVKFLTLSVEGTNLLNTVDKNFYYIYPELPNGLRAMGRTVTLGARFRF